MTVLVPALLPPEKTLSQLASLDALQLHELEEAVTVKLNMVCPEVSERGEVGSENEQAAVVLAAA